MPAPTGCTSLQIALHWIAAALIVMQYLFKDAISGAWEAIGTGRQRRGPPLPVHRRQAAVRRR